MHRANMGAGLLLGGALAVTLMVASVLSPSPWTRDDGDAGDPSHFSPEPGDPYAYFDEWGDLGSVRGSLATVSGTIEEVVASPVGDRGLPVDIQSQVITLGDASYGRDLSRGPEFATYLQEFKAAVQTGSLQLHFSRGTFDVGERVTVFVGLWGQEGFSVLYALKDGEVPVPGFDNDASKAGFIALESRMPGRDKRYLAEEYALASNRAARGLAVKAELQDVVRSNRSDDRSRGVPALGTRELPVIPEQNSPEQQCPLGGAG